jgi:molybdenum cofactor cytidylyltransferase
VGTCDPIREVRRRVAAVVAAAGRSLRMEGDTAKQLLPWAESTVIGRVVETLAQCPISPLLVVTGHCAKEVRQELAETGIQTIYNPDYETGEMLSSIQVGVDALGNVVSGCLVVLADQPWLQAEIVESLLDAYASSPAGIVAPVFQGRRGHPVLIDRRHWMELLALEPGLAPRHLLQRHPADTRLVLVESDSVIRDMDTLDDYRQALDRSSLHHR